jgi:hypothetical protein
MRARYCRPLLETSNNDLGYVLRVMARNRIRLNTRERGILREAAERLTRQPRRKLGRHREN